MKKAVFAALMAAAISTSAFGAFTIKDIKQNGIYAGEIVAGLVALKLLKGFPRISAVVAAGLVLDGASRILDYNPELKRSCKKQVKELKKKAENLTK